MVERYSKLSLFGTKGRLGRYAYFLFSFIIPVSIFGLISAIAGQLNRQGIISKEITYGLIIFAILLALFMLIRLTMQRSHDLNRSGWLSAILVLFPPLVALFWLAPGSKGTNNYLAPSQPLSWFMKLLSLLFFLGLLLPVIYLVKEYSVVENITQWTRPWIGQLVNQWL